MLAKFSQSLTDSKFLPWRLRHLGGPLNTVISAPMRRRTMRSQVDKILAKDELGVSFIVACKNRADFRLTNLLKSVSMQDYSRGPVQLTLVDYGSDEACRDHLRALILDTGHQYCRIDRTDWNKSHALNIGIRNVQSEIIIIADVDCIFSSNYVATVAQTLDNWPLSAVYSRCLDLPQEAEPYLRHLAENDCLLDWSRLLAKAAPRSGGTCNPGIVSTFRCFFEMIRGFDEFYELWGWEDWDVQRRFKYLGLEIRSIYEKASYLHQWHPKFDGAKEFPNFEETLVRNEAHFRRSHSIVRNVQKWGAANCVEPRSSLPS